MDRVELTIADVERLIEWRGLHPAEVRSHPAPLKAVEIHIKENGWCIKGVREGDKLRLYLSKNGVRMGHCEFVRRADGMWVSVKNKMDVDRDGLQSVLTVYCSLMALMAFGHAEERERPAEAEETAAKKPTRGRKTRKPKRTTYILRQENGALVAAPRGSHASPAGIFSVRGHFRHYKSGRVVWIAEYKKGTGKRKAKTYKMGGGTDGQ